MSTTMPVGTLNKVPAQCGTEKNLAETRTHSAEASNWKNARETMAQQKRQIESLEAELKGTPQKKLIQKAREVLEKLLNSENENIRLQAATTMLEQSNY